MVGFKGSCEGALEATIVNSRKVLVQQRGRKFIRLQNGGANLRTGAAKKAKIRLAVALGTKPVDLARNSHDGQSVGIIQCHGEAQYRQLPGAQGSWRAIRFRERLNSFKTPIRRSGSFCEKAAVPVLDRTGDILVADRGDRACDLGLIRIGQFDDRQPSGGRHEAEQAQRVFQRGGAFPGERSRQGRQPALQISRRLQSSLPAVGEGRLAQFRVAAPGMTTGRGCCPGW